MPTRAPADIQRWITTLQKYGLEFHAWGVPRGLNIDGEANILTQTAQVAGVRSLILDVKPYENFFTGGRSAIRPLMSRIRSQIPGAFHIGMAVDPRSTQYAPIFPDEWFPFVNSVLLQLYWVTFQVTPDQALANGYKTWGSYNRPVFPVLQGYRAGAAQVDQARTLATSTYKSNGLSWWVLGQMNADDLSAANKYVNGQVGVVAPGADGSTPNYGAAITVSVGGPGYSDGAFQNIAPGLGTFQTYTNPSGGTGKFHPTNEGVSNVWARWDPQIKASGWYTLEAYVPNQHATTGKARYKLHGVLGQGDEVILTLPQLYYHNEWAPLGTFQLDVRGKEAGVVYLNDWTFEPGLEIAFDALRWRPVIAPGTSSSGGSSFSVPRIISNMQPRAKEIYLKGKANGLRTNVFSKGGDSITVSPNFLIPIGKAQYDLGTYADLLPALQFFSQQDVRGAGNSFANPPLAAGPGWKAETLFYSAYSDPCGAEIILNCEYSRVKPAVSLIMVGTNDSDGTDPTFYTTTLKKILDTTINLGILPVLSTIPPKKLDAASNGRVDQWNLIIKGIAQQYQIPLWDYWYALQIAPNQGISSDGVHPSAPANNNTGSFTTPNLSYGYNIRNLTALMVLNAIWKQVLY